MSGGLRVTILLAILLCTGLSLVLALEFKRTVGQPSYGATFSPDYARFLGLDPRQVFPIMLEELPLRHVRIPIHWSDIQPEEDAYNFTELDWIMTEAAQHNVKVVLAVGNKVPRWPECHTPDWAFDLDQTAYEQALLAYIDTVVLRYRTHSALERWQVENEALFVFGECPARDYALVKREIAHVKALDSQHLVQLTVSGEQQLWASEALEADVIGTSMYRKVALPNGWQVTFPIPPRWYSLQAISILPFVDKVVISELQAEPWLTKDYREYTPAEAANLFTPQHLNAYLGYAGSTGLNEVSLWGIEWWYYLKQNGYPELWQAGQELLTAESRSR
ncbi:MAG: beta-galactosidase [Patescibacteria group bacterium]